MSNIVTRAEACPNCTKKIDDWDKYKHGGYCFDCWNTGADELIGLRLQLKQAVKLLREYVDDCHYCQTQRQQCEACKKSRPFLTAFDGQKQGGAGK